MFLTNYAIVKKNNKDCLYGEIYNDERFEDGHHIVTTEIVEINEKTATTKSGTVYDLGEKLINKEEIENLKIWGIYN